MITYKEITAEDIGSLAELFVQTFNAPPWNNEFTKETAALRLAQMINVQDFYGLCAYWEYELCGMILGCKEQYSNTVMFNVREFCISNDLQGKGIGSKLFTEFENRLRQQGVGEIILYTLKDEMTLNFYKKNGFEAVDNLVMMGKKII